MRFLFGTILGILLFFFGCRPQDVQVTITYDKNPSNGFPYTYYGETAKIYYTLPGKSFEKTIQNHRSVQLVVPEKTEIRVTFDKFISDVNGQRSTLEGVYYKVNSDNPNFIIR